MDIPAGDRRRLAAIAELAYCNPFCPRRLTLEREALGQDFDDSDPHPWSRTQATARRERNNVVRLNAHAERLMTALAPQAATLTAEPLASQYAGLVAYVLYYRHFADKDLEVFSVAGTGRLSQLWRRFQEDYHRFLADRDSPAQHTASATHLFACFSQVRRAFRHIFDCILGESRHAARLREAVWQSIFTHDMRRYRRTLYGSMRELPTLITGPSGTGKELVARAIALSQYIPFDPVREHFAGGTEHAFLPLNLSALSPTLIESELFGHRRGAFTGAITDRPGWLEACPPHGGVFLDEIGELDAAIQVKLLRVVQHRTYNRLGESDERQFHGKLLAATNRELTREIEDNHFRIDLFYRLCADRIETPTLAEQHRDEPNTLSLLVNFVAERIAPGEAGGLADEALTWITTHLPNDYPWEGNIRELEQCVRNILVRKHYSPSHRRAAHRVPWLEAARCGSLSNEQLLTAYTTWVYTQQGTYEATAKQLGVDRRTVKSRVDEALLREFRGGPASSVTKEPLPSPLEVPSKPQP